MDEMPDSSMLSELGEADKVALCEWGAMVTSEKLPANINCRGVEIEVASCMTPGTECPATVSQWRTCLPALLERIADDPCLTLALQSQSDVADFLEATPGCEGLGVCGMFVD
jgi:hypothetical protein